MNFDKFVFIFNWDCMFNFCRYFLTMGLVVSMVACGGGGSTATENSTLSATQQNFEASVLKDSYTNFYWNLPDDNVTPVAGKHYFIASANSVSTSPSGGAVTNSNIKNNMTSTLAMPNLENLGVTRILKGGVIYVLNSTTKRAWRYVGRDVVLDFYATDGVTIIESDVYDSWSEPISLIGSIANTEIIRRSLSFSRLTQPLNFDFTKDWIGGSSYFTRQGYFQSDLLNVYDYTGATFDSNVVAYTGVETTIEGFFGSSRLSAVGGWNVDDVLYKLSDGVIRDIQGARVWVAKNKRPTSAFATDNYLALIELNGKIYVGGLRKAGARFRFVDGVDRTVVNDFDIRLNGAATYSIYQTVKF